MRNSPRSPTVKTNGSSREGNRIINPHSRIPKSTNKQTNKLSYWQVVSSAPESNFTGIFDAVVSGAMILRHTDPQLGPIQLLCPSSAPRRTTRQIYFDYFD